MGEKAPNFADYGVSREGHEAGEGKINRLMLIVILFVIVLLD